MARVPDDCYDHVINSVREMLRERGVKLRLFNKRFLGTECGSEAWFDPATKTVDIATKRRPRIEVLMMLLHEAGHVEQWHTNDFNWRMCYIGKQDVSEIADEYVSGTRTYPETIINYTFNALYMLEADAEIRAIAYARQFGLQDFLDFQEYAQGANAYLRSYLYTKHTRKWVPANRPPYAVRSLVEGQPTTINLDYRLDEYLWLNHFIGVYET